MDRSLWCALECIGSVEKSCSTYNSDPSFDASLQLELTLPSTLPLSDLPTCCRQSLPNSVQTTREVSFGAGRTTFDSGCLCIGQLLQVC